MASLEPRTWIVRFEDKARKIMQKMDPSTRHKIAHYLHTHVSSCHNPRQSGHGLTGPLQGLWRYRVGDYRIVCRIDEDSVTVLVVHVGHRSSVYKNIHL